MRGSAPRGPFARPIRASLRGSARHPAADRGCCPGPVERRLILETAMMPSDLASSQQVAGRRRRWLLSRLTPSRGAACVAKCLSKGCAYQHDYSVLGRRVLLLAPRHGGDRGAGVSRPSDDPPPDRSGRTTGGRAPQAGPQRDHCPPGAPPVPGVAGAPLPAEPAANAVAPRCLRQLHLVGQVAVTAPTAGCRPRWQARAADQSAGSPP